MPELLFELGCEELPASFVRRAYEQLEQEIKSRLSEEEIPHGSSISLGTPRRLIVSIQDVADQQPDRRKEVRGPGIKAAYDADGNPTKALEGFCRAQSVATSDLRQDEDYVWATKQIHGRPTADILSEVLPSAVRSLTFDKAMRWGESRMRFARPIRWMLASFGDKLVPFSIENVSTGLVSRGHRFDGDQEIHAGDLKSLLQELRAKGKVEADPDVRRKTIVESATRIAEGFPEMTEELIEENVFLTEWPSAIQGEFRPEFLSLPEPVLVTAMAKHERFFPIRDASGSLVNKFVSIRNGGTDDVVRTGNAWVLNARFNDAKFFFDEDCKHTLSDFLERTNGIIFQEKLGTIRQRAERLEKLSRFVAQYCGLDDATASQAARAGLLSKADLSTGLVSELTSLQGIIGGEYAKRDSEPVAVCDAIRTHYSTPGVLSLREPARSVAICLCVADHLDKLAGFIGIHLIPSGSSDPNALRRSAAILAELATATPALSDFRAPLESAAKFYADQGTVLSNETILNDIGTIFEARYDIQFSHVRHDIRSAATLPTQQFKLDDRLSPRRVRLKIEALELLSSDTATIQAATRPLNIMLSAINKNQYRVGTLLNTSNLDSETGLELDQALDNESHKISQAFQSESAQDIVESVLLLAKPINAFFDCTMIMSDDSIVREARLSLLEKASRLLLTIGNFSMLATEG